MNYLDSGKLGQGTDFSNNFKKIIWTVECRNKTNGEIMETGALIWLRRVAPTVKRAAIFGAEIRSASANKSLRLRESERAQPGKTKVDPFATTY
jgi:hypothetical protein